MVREHKKRLIHISTDEVYGEFPCGSNADEGFPMKPNNPYSVTKASIDMMIQAYIRTYGIQANIVRFVNNFGPYQGIDKFIPKIISSAIENQRIPLYGDGKHIRQWIYVKDTCWAIQAVIEKGKDGEIYNVRGVYEAENIEIITRILEQMNASKNLIQFVEDRKGHDRRYGITGTKLELLGWLPRVDFAEAINETIQWYISNRYLWRNKWNQSISHP
jgi:dTDP-glucose 4,6-dehydratase